MHLLGKTRTNTRGFVILHILIYSIYKVALLWGETQL